MRADSDEIFDGLRFSLRGSAFRLSALIRDICGSKCIDPVERSDGEGLGDRLALWRA
jgi:hypothetical protein